MISTLISLLIAGLVLYVIFYIVGMFIKGQPLNIIGYHPGPCLPALRAPRFSRRGDLDSAVLLIGKFESAPRKDTKG